MGPVSTNKETQDFVVLKGESVADIAQKLKEDSLIKSPDIFRFYVKFQGVQNKIQPGRFKISPSMSVPQLTNVLTNKPEDMWVTLLEGWRMEEMAQKLNDTIGINKSDFLKIAKEGYMFPDTYLFPKDVTAQLVASEMRNTFDIRYSNELQTKIKKLGLTPEEGVILASIVEREARSDEVRTKVAGILLKRLNIGMGLNADATVQYALGYQPSEKSWWKRHLSLDDLKVKSPYNTYLHAGLPPTPISNPSLSSLEAVANADPSTPYLYYYHDSKGNSYYAKTLEEHNKNVANHP